MEAGTTAQQVEEVVYGGLIELGIDREDLGRDVAFEALEIDSLDLVELRQMIEEQYGVEIAKEELASLRTIGDVIDLVSQRV